MADTEKPLLIKRYASRRLYNTETSDYVTLEDIAGFIRKGREVLAFGGSSIGAVGIIATVGLSMFPFILPSSIDPASSLTVWNASSTQTTLFIMLGCTVVFLPLILIYTAWVYRVLWGRTSAAALKTNPDLY